jgi:hypothetical protein
VAQFDEAYREMRAALGQNPNLVSPEQRTRLLQYLNAWRCRIPTKHFPVLEVKLKDWATRWIAKLPDAGRDIRSLAASERAEIGDSYENLLELGSGLNFQDTAVAKTFHAIRPVTLPMWDSKIKCELTRRGPPTQRPGQMYCGFVSYVADEISQLEEDAKRLGFSLSEIPKLVDRQGATLVKLVDEFHYTTITLRHETPTGNQLARWLAWVG